MIEHHPTRLLARSVQHRSRLAPWVYLFVLLRTALRGRSHVVTPAIRSVDLVDLDVFSWSAISVSLSIYLEMIGISGDLSILIKVDSRLSDSPSRLFSFFLMIDV